MEWENDPEYEARVTGNENNNHAKDGHMQVFPSDQMHKVNTQWVT